MWGGIDGRKYATVVAQTPSGLEMYENLMLRWAKECTDHPRHAFPRQRQTRPMYQKIDRFRYEADKLKAERVIQE